MRGWTRAIDNAKPGAAAHVCYRFELTEGEGAVDRHVQLSARNLQALEAAGTTQVAKGG
jgi:hypothetical protein